MSMIRLAFYLFFIWLFLPRFGANWAWGFTAAVVTTFCWEHFRGPIQKWFAEQRAEARQRQHEIERRKQEAKQEVLERQRLEQVHAYQLQEASKPPPPIIPDMDPHLEVKYQGVVKRWEKNCETIRKSPLQDYQKDALLEEEYRELERRVSELMQ